MSMDVQLRQVFCDVFGMSADEVDSDASPHTISSWDSVGHLNLILALEGEFGIQFDAEEIPELVSYDTIRGRIARLTDSGA